MAARSSRRLLLRSCPLLAALMLIGPSAAGAQTPASTPPPESQKPQTPPPDPPVTFTVTVVGTTPLSGVELPAGQVPGPVQTATDREIDNSGALDVSDFLNRRMNGVHVNEAQNIPSSRMSTTAGTPHRLCSAHHRVSRSTWTAYG